MGSKNFSLYGQEANGSTWALAVMNMFLHGFDDATIRWGDTIRNPKLKEGDALMKFDTVVANPPFSLDKWGKVEDKYSYVATYNELEENDFNLNIPRYVDTFEEEVEVNIAAVQQEIESLVRYFKTYCRRWQRIFQTFTQA